MKVELLKKHSTYKTPASVEEIKSTAYVYPDELAGMYLTWNFCSEKTTQALSTLADVIVETEACFQEYINSKDGDTAPLAEAHDILRGALKTIELMKMGDAHEKTPPIKQDEPAR